MKPHGQVVGLPRQRRATGGGGLLSRSSLVVVACALFACGLASAEGDSQRPYRLVTVAEGLSWPRCLAFLPDGDLLVTERDGALRLVHDGALQSRPIAGMPPVYGWRGQNGLFDVVLHPDFAANGPPTVYLHEHGPEGGDELNRLEPRRNYGWPLATFGVGYDGEMISPFTEYAGTERPLLHWTPSIAPSGMAWYGSDLFPHWQGDLFVATFKAWAIIVRIDLENGHVVGQEQLFKEIGEPLRDVRVGPNGHLYILTNSRQGRIIRVDPVP